MVEGVAVVVAGCYDGNGLHRNGLGDGGGGAGHSQGPRGRTRPVGGGGGQHGDHQYAGSAAGLQPQIPEI